MAGGRICVYPPPSVRYRSDEATIAGNTCLYGATGGQLFAAGRAGERFAVRNSGAQAVVEGVGEHGCEYMTGGTVVVLGRSGSNFAAGMTNGIAFVFDEQQTFSRNCNTEFVQLLDLNHPVLDGYDQLLLNLLENHTKLCNSDKSRRITACFEEFRSQFVVIVPKRESDFLQNLLARELQRCGLALNSAEKLPRTEDSAAIQAS